MFSLRIKRFLTRLTFGIALVSKAAASMASTTYLPEKDSPWRPPQDDWDMETSLPEVSRRIIEVVELSKSQTRNDEDAMRLSFLMIEPELRAEMHKFWVAHSLQHGRPLGAVVSMVPPRSGDYNLVRGRTFEPVGSWVELAKKNDTDDHYDG